MQPLPTPQPRPQPLPAPAPPQRHRGRNLLILFGVLAAAGIVAYTQRGNLMPSTGGPGGGIVSVRTAPASTGAIERTLRLTGVTMAERSASLISPQMRGHRGGGATVVVSGGRGGGGGQMVVQVSSGGGGGGGGGSSSSSAASSSSGGGSSSVSSGTSSGSSSSFRGATNRFASSTASRTSTASTSSSTSASSSSSSSTSSGGGGGGTRMSGGGSDFMQVLQNVAPAGKIVAKGQQVAEFDTQYQQIRLDDERTDLEQSERGVRQLEVQLEVSRAQNQFALQQARAVVDKAKLDLKTIPVLSQIQAERMKLQLEEAEAQLKQLLAEEPMRRTSEAAEMRQAQIQLATTRTELKQAEANLEKMRIKAPMDGMVVMQKIMAGSEFRQIQQGDQLYPGQMFMQIVDPSSMLVAASVNQTDSEFIRVGAKAHLRFDAYPGLELPGRVISIGAVPRSGGMRGDYMKEIPVYLKIEKMTSV